MFVFKWHNNSITAKYITIFRILTNNSYNSGDDMFRGVQTILCENPYNKLWDSFLFFENEPVSKSFLQEIYREKFPEQYRSLAFQNTAKFIYNIKQARQYYAAAMQSEIIIRPLLLYYGMVSLLKAFILTQDPFYPANTRVLQHGLTSRKIKKSNYSLGEDEIKIQKEGLLPYVYSFLTNKPIENRYKVQDLFSIIPELHTTYQKVYQMNNMVSVNLSSYYDFQHPSTLFYLPESVLDYTHLCYESFIHYLNRYNTGSSYFSPSPLETPKGIIRIEWKHPLQQHVTENGNGFENELFLVDYKGNFYFLLHGTTSLPEISTHFMIMYILGMLCRYETERWGEIVFSFASEELYIIHEFLSISSRKFPNLIYDLLMGERHIFQMS